MTVNPSYGEHTSLVLMLKPKLGEPVSMSLLGGILQLFSDGKYFLSAIIFLFSVVFPMWKLSILWWAAIALDYNLSPEPKLKLLEKIGKFSMLDIYVMAVLILAIKGLPGGTAVTINWGLYAFAISILFSLLIPSWISKSSAA